MTSLTIDMPGAFVSDFSGTSVGQGLVENAGYDGAPLLYAAYRDARRINTGKGYRLRLTLTGTEEDVEGALYCLWHHADVYVEANSDGEPEMYAYRAAALKMRDRCREVGAAAGFSMADWR